LISNTILRKFSLSKSKIIGLLLQIKEPAPLSTELKKYLGIDSPYGW
jgi:hypothetical protein